MRATVRIFVAAIAVLFIGGCTGLQGHDPIQVTVAGIEPLEGEGLELRMLVKLRVQNPNDEPLDYNGAYLKLEVLDKTFATGVSDQGGSVPRFGEAVIAVPVTVSALRMARYALGMLDGRPIDKVTYELSGKLNRSAFSAARFSAAGEIDLSQVAERDGASAAAPEAP
jgi:LEA14-like dessication related protein